jgi:predicted porin
MDNWQVSSYASRIGVKGSETLNTSLSVIYGIEWAVSGDTAGGASDLVARNRFLGLKHSDFGTLKLGALDTNLKNVQGKIDLFNDTRADISDGSGLIFAGETRASNVIAYESPKIADAVSINVQLIPGEASGVGAAPANQFNGLLDGISTSVAYDKSGLYLALGYDKEVAGNLGLVASNVGRRDSLRAAASYKLADLTLGAMYQTSKAVNVPAVAPTVAETEDAWLISAAYKIDKTTLKAQYGAAKNDAAANADERSRYTVGVDYALAPQTKVYGYYTGYEKDTGLVASSAESKTLAMGLEYNF